ncbi:dihydropteridine reductase [Plasmopara halstedii]|uniref:nitric oxide dioxygenase n=1 Tax=Plasmopara halstedii TaxID=4781 RepID=A0A0P1AGV1_PLAHL|nr:dihydropteridine reductase [Plasmopara halstedii]CEG40309.1 dihydropteridine reductase [Plasmopara halstedii]|eukprot:XP_024576678.1 dihydropteridine reductase [Plasmopara halstedii]
MAPNQHSTTTDRITESKVLSAETISILKTTAPVVKVHGNEITSTMYKIMFSEFPEVQNLFNMSHHRVAGATKGGAPSGVSRQAATLANAVIGFAANCDQLDNLGDAVPRMVHKHVSLDIRAKHYPIVGGCLLRAIKQVLGNAATDEIMDAWKEAYWFLAHLLIQAEDQMRDEFEGMPGGWVGYRELRVARKVKESTEVTSFYLESTDPSKGLMNFKPGQFLSLKFDQLQSDRSIVRNYSLSSAPGQKFYRISVKKESGTSDIPAGIVSSYLHDHVTIGSILHVGPPCGHFQLEPSTKPIVFISGGVGTTPLLSMLESLLASSPKKKSKKSIRFVQYARNPNVVAFRKHIEKITKKNESVTAHTVYGSFDLKQFETFLPSRDCEFYFCGPAGFMTTVYKALSNKWGIPTSQLHYEYFGPTQDISAETSIRRPSSSCPFAMFDSHTQEMSFNCKNFRSRLVVAAMVATTAVLLTTILRLRK